MKKFTKVAITVTALSIIAGGAVYAHDKKRGDRGGRMGMNFSQMDQNNDDAVSREEFAQGVIGRFEKADANADGKLTVDEMAATIERRRAERRAKRMIRRFDLNGDGEVTKAEIENRTGKRFALLDRNDDGKIEKSEMPRRGKRHHRRKGHGWGGNN